MPVPSKLATYRKSVAGKIGMATPPGVVNETDETRA